MKKLIVSAFAFALAFSTVQAQEITERKQERKNRHESAYTKLDLTAEQKTQFKAANEEFRKKAEALRKDDQITVKESRTKMQSLKQEHKAKIEGLLTAEQKTKMESFKKERMDKGDKKDFDNKKKGEFSKKKKDKGEKMKEKLGLTEDQVAKMKANREAISAEIKVIREDKSLTEDAKKAKVMELKKKQKEEFRKMLTEEQVKKLGK